ncbi:MAG: sterol desaturase family protein [Tabrizicola sp.]|uniref:sterol desaturase family protein n=1 Tax=Tabrizicola sp. TaxID=2005166 RepID=UPI002732D485|nr:sterol desaturase family protein [Tabrizicola sp.]MDP3262013.1 sterol desaturase family protein [Tabrizicola sp.]
MTDQPPRREIWNHHPQFPIPDSALFHWPPNPRAALWWLTRRWVQLTSGTLFLATAVLIWNLLQPSTETMQTLAPGWILAIWARNLLLLTLYAGTLHLWLFTFTLQGDRLKYDARPLMRDNGSFAFRDQVLDNMFHSLTSGVAAWTLFEVLYWWGTSNNLIPTLTIHGNELWFLLWLLAVPIFTSAHFYFVHRLLHWPPLYARVHALHHRSINIGPWSGLSMHPVESLLYASAVLIHFIVPSHPVIFLVHLYIKMIGPAFSHAGFEGLLARDTRVINAGDFHHQLHHRFFECNYGTAEVPWDRWFGSFHDGTDEATQRIKDRRRRMTRKP